MGKKIFNFLRWQFFVYLNLCALLPRVLKNMPGIYFPLAIDQIWFNFGLKDNFIYGSTCF